MIRLRQIDGVISVNLAIPHYLAISITGPGLRARSLSKNKSLATFVRAITSSRALSGLVASLAGTIHESAVPRGEQPGEASASVHNTRTD